VHLARIVLDPVQLPAENQPPLPGHHTVFPLLRRGGALPDLKEMRTLRKTCERVVQETGEADAVRHHGFRRAQSAKLRKRRKHVDIKTHPVDITAASDAVLRPANEKRNPVPAIIIIAFFSAHSGIVASGDVFVRIQNRASAGTVVGHENENGVLAQPVPGEKCIQSAEVFVDIGDHAVKLRTYNIRIVPVG